MRTRLFDLFYIGMGPSSSHTIGPMKASKQFLSALNANKLLDSISSVTIELCGSLALTGIGHHTDKAIILGLMGFDPVTIDTEKVEGYLNQIQDSSEIVLLGKKKISFKPQENIIFKKREKLQFHPNGMIMKAFSESGDLLHEETYYSIGGGSIVSGEDIKHHAINQKNEKIVPHPFLYGRDLLLLSSSLKCSIADIMLENELAYSSKEAIENHILALWDVMQEAIQRGIRKEGILPGGLNVKRRAPGLYQSLKNNNNNNEPAEIFDWLSVFAIATNEENASGGRVVTAPTNGSSGVIPSVLMYYNNFYKKLDLEDLMLFFLTSGAIGVLYKENASLSGAEMGCQGEVGVACSMAAAGLAALMGGTPEQIECAAEIGMEHNLGLTCDPVKGLVQIPCIERNSMGAIKAVNAARLALHRTETQKISLDRVIQTMKATGLDMKSKYKETSKGGLALHNVEC